MSDPHGPGSGQETQVVVELLGRHMAFLARLSEEVRRSTGAWFQPAVIIRALVEALEEAGGVDAAGIASEDDLRDFFYRRFTRQEDRRHDRDRFRP